MKMRLAFITALCAAGLARADQAAWVAQEAAQRAAMLLENGMEVQFFCAPCGDAAPEHGIVDTVTAAPVPNSEYYEVVLNGKGIDLAYVYAAGANLALAVGLEVSDVPAYLEDCGLAGERGFQRVLYSGLIDGRLHAHLELNGSGRLVFGTYVYEHVRIPISLRGTVQPDGKFSMEEHSEDGMSGTWQGAFSGGGAAAEGQWISSDGNRKLPFRLTRLAVHSEEASEYRALGYSCTVELEYPEFYTLPEVNAAIRKEIEEARDIVLGAWNDEVRDNAQTGEDRFAMHDYALAVQGYQIYHADDKLVSVLMDAYMYAGGAHPNTNFITTTMKKGEDGRFVAAPVTEFLQPGPEAMKVLSDILMGSLKKQEASSVVSGAIDAFTAEQLRAFVVSTQGMTVFFAPYAVASYAEGAFEVHVPWSELGAHANTGLLLGK